MKKLTKKDFQEMRFDVVNIPRTKKVIEAYPELAVYTEFTDFEIYKQLPLNTCLRYIILFYSPDSPIVKQMNEPLDHRKAEAWMWAGIKSDTKGRYPKAVNDVLNFKSLEFNRMVVRYMRHVGHFNWNSLVMALEMYYTDLADLSNPVKDGGKMSRDSKKKLLEGLEDYKNIITKHSSEIFQEHDTPELIVEVDKIHQEETGKITDWTTHYAGIVREREAENNE